MTTPTPLPHAVAIQLCSDFDEASYRCGDPNHSPISCTCMKLVMTWRTMQRDLTAAQEALRRATTPVANVILSGDAQYWQDRAQRAEALAESNARDAQRYRWLRDKAKLEYMHPKAMEDSRMEWCFPRLFGMTCVMTEIPVDEAIDAAIAEGK